MTRSLVIMLHGVGSNGADLTPLGAACSASLPEVDFVAPDAPYSFGHAAGRQWFSVDGVTPANRPGRVADARAAFDAVLGGIIATHGLSAHLDRVVLLGFSQGSIMALDALATGRCWSPALSPFLAGLPRPCHLHRRL